MARGHHDQSVATGLTTEVAGLTLRVLSVEQADEYYGLIDRNREHLTRHGDYEALAASDYETARAELLDAPDPSLRCGILLRGSLIGRVDLVAANPPAYGFGYWLDHEATGHGYATAACRALIDYGATALGATDVFAGVTHGNDKSGAVLTRLGFQVAEVFESYTRYHRTLVGPPCAGAAQR
ncbi:MULTISPECIES: GNAT family N-acetyltransferase [unclassified Streptomyces]|uniref:GNAT family N-acetyltransferase n=1 Tax=unclassified Streptomyces TaxID=2593676 RepID=UPI002E2E813E|nr:GNAT family N-acetyltransferase [Streptomyces sp. NBC_01439]